MNKKINEWNTHIAKKLAIQENIILTTEHLEIIYIFKQLYNKFHTLPNMVILVNVIKNKYGILKGNSIYIHKLFPNGAIRQIAYISGLKEITVCL
ncbi:TusE/DsrC/DsvC family sulfur relay protein [Enterobacteriaceae endosymbiont of Macroplea appendiculata]|uniref:TusE/DsrC/DsvC family sulfur relay protein n=1 Tax=Enterobacteriaceae endosymbiont of Macroplea appendiculata TaxID=2675790 RepID=UPI0014492EDC|nr:TusE/DsrC/DsvC family sulfur relay protein [Enterobacteriaceae endosymbiont of Macroplea appendiculata]QJC30646.1 TusE/DsrC/DsvC family sulfur relay protein [Enterobacteriaceae endosymbiont of Macroplea appendiculata]